MAKDVFNSLRFSYHNGGKRDLHPTEIMKAKAIHVKVFDSRTAEDKNFGIEVTPSNVGFDKPRLVKAVKASVEIPNVKASATGNIDAVISKIEKRIQRDRLAKRKPRAKFNALFKDK